MNVLSGKTAVVIGGGSGIGEAVALELAAQGMDIAVASLTPGRAQAVGAALAARGTNSLAETLDVRDRQQMRQFATLVFARFGRVDLLCNNAGVLVFSDVVEMTDDDWDLVIDVNVKGVVNGVAAFLPGMLEQGGPSHITNTSSLAGLIATGRMPLAAYTLSRFAVVGFSEALRLELEPTGIEVSVFCPGTIHTRARERAKYAPSSQSFRLAPGEPPKAPPGMKVLSPREAALHLVEGIRANQSHIFTHQEGRAFLESRSTELLDQLNGQFKREQDTTSDAQVDS